MDVVEIDAPHGLARAHLDRVESSTATLVLGHGGGGGVEAPDLAVASEAARSAGLSVALVEQPYRVAGRRSPAPARQLDANWLAVIERLRLGGDLGPLVAGGRSLGARVACRTAHEAGAAAVLCLAFPLRPPRRKGAAEQQDRQPELDTVAVPTLVVQGERDRFGMPAGQPGSRGGHGCGRSRPQGRSRRGLGRDRALAARCRRLAGLWRGRSPWPRWAG